MLKKILISFVIFLGLFGISFFLVSNNVFAGDLTSPGFTIDVGEISPGGESLKLEGSNITQKVNFLLGTIIQKLMIALGSIALLIMTIGGGYMIFYHGQDELLSKGKSIFMSGVIALIVALSSYYIVSLVRFILYSNS